MQYKKIIYQLFLLLIIYLPVVGQKPDLRFERITDKNGRSLGFTTGVVQDSIGFLWISSRKGLFKYDGYNYKLYRNEPNDTNSLSYRNFTSIYKDNNETIWLKHFNKFEAFENERKSRNFKIITNKDFAFETKIVQDADMYYWVGPTENGLYRFDIQKDTFEIFKKSPPEYHPELYDFLKKTIIKNNFIAKLDKITNNKDTSTTFAVANTNKYLIITVGEANDKQNYDFGTITKDNKIIWTPNSNKAKHAGGNEKNKIQVELIELKQGKYSLSYQTDNSNAYNNWKTNEDPDKIDFYGIAVIKISKDEILNTENIINKSYSAPNTILSNNYNDIGLDDKGNVFIASPKGFDFYNKKTNSFDHIEINFVKILNLESEKDLAIQKVIYENNGTFWLGTNNSGLIKFNLKNKDITVFKNTEKNEILTSNFIYSLFKDSKGKIWIGTDKGLNLYLPREKSFYKYPSDVKNRLYDNLIIDIYQDRAENIWIATPEGLNKQRKSQFRYFDLKTQGHTLPVHIDRRYAANQLWFCNNKTPEIICYDKDRNVFENYCLNLNYFAYNKDTRQRWIIFNDIFEDSRNNLWLAIESGIYNFDRASGTVIDSVKISGLDIKNKITDEYDISDFKDGIPDNITFVRENFDNNLLIFALAGIYSYNPKTRKIEAFYSFDNKFEFLYDVNTNFIKFVTKDKLDNFWIRTENGIYHFNVRTKKLKIIHDFEPNLKGTSATNGNIIEFNNNVCFAVMPDIFLFDYSNDKAHKYSFHENIDVGNSNIFLDNDSSFWIYSDNGLFKFSDKDTIIKRYTIEDGLADNQLNGMLDDNNGGIWITSSKGISYFNKRLVNFEIISTDFEHINFIGLSEHKRKRNGQAILFTDKGFYSFFPDSINLKKPPIAITKFTLNGKDYNIDSLYDANKEITLEWNQNFFVFEFAALDFTDPSKNQYAYMLDGLDKDWVTTDANTRKAGYTGISPKKYSFRVKASNNNNIWNENGIAVTINITPPFWRTPWFFAIMSILIIIGVVQIIKWRERNLQKEKRILEQKVTERTKEIERQKKEIEAQRDIATKQRDQIAEQKQAIMDSIHYAQRIQRAILPPTENIQEVLPHHFILFKPRDVVSGDFYWMTTKNKQTIITAADCTGHGVPGAFMSMLGIAFLNEIVSKQDYIAANEILNSLKEHVIKSLHQTGKEGESKDGMDIALCVIEHEKMKIQFAGAYNPLYLIRNGELSQIKADHMPIGIYNMVNQPFTNNIVDVEKNDTVYMFSDGYADQFGGEKGRKFMAKRFKELLISIQDKNMDEQRNILDNEITQWMKNTEQIDDILVIGIKI